MITEDAARQIIEAALRSGGDFADLFLEDKDVTSITLEDGKIESATTGKDAGAGLRVIAGDTTYYSFTDSHEPGPLLDLARSLADTIRSKESSETIITVKPPRPVPPAVTQRVKISPADVELKAKADIVLRADQAARQAGSEIKQVMANLSDSVQKIAIANSEGFFVNDRRVLTRIFVNAVAARDGVVQTGYEAPGIMGGYELFDDETPEATATTAAKRAIVMLDAKDAPTGEMPVILASGNSGVLFHEASGHGLEADAIRKGASVFTGKMGQKVAADIVSAADDPSLANRWGSFSFDDEGTPAKPTLLIENGYLKEYMFDRLSAFQMNAAPTPNGRRQSFRFVPQPRMTNTFIMPGEARVEDMLDGVSRGLYAVSLGGGEVNPVTGDFVFGVTEAYMIEDGKVTYPVKGAILIGDGLRVLSLIDMIADDVQFDTGMCGKGGQSVPAGTGMPTLRVSRLTVGGTQE